METKRDMASSPSTFNMLLREAGVDPAAVSLLRHQTRRNGVTPHMLREQSIVQFERYQATQQDRPVFRQPGYWASFVSPTDHETLFVGLYRVTPRPEMAITWPDPLGGGVVGDGKEGPYLFWETALASELSEQIGKLYIDWGRSLRSWAQHATRQDKAIVPGTVAQRPETGRKHFSAPDLEHALIQFGFIRAHATKKMARFERGPLIVYLKLDTRRLPIVIHPYYEHALGHLLALDGVTTETPFGYYRRVHMTRFPSYDRPKPSAPGRYGIDLAVTDDAALRRLIAFLEEERLINGEVAIGDAMTPEETEREARCLARVGQGRFRLALIDQWNGGCAVTGITLPELLRASHIKPWAKANDAERMDAYNGLLLSAHIDALFDRYLIGFNDDGRMIASPALEPSVLDRLGLGDARLRHIAPAHLSYLAHQRARLR